jgi:hypothetical protein
MADARITADDLRKCSLRAITFLDGAKGAAIQVHECVEHPRLGVTWTRKDRNDKGETFYTVDGIQVETLDDAAALLNKPRAENIKEDNGNG